MDHLVFSNGVHSSRWVQGDLPFRGVKDETPYISEYLNFSFYYHVSYKENFGIGMTVIVSWLGVSHRVVGLMSYWVLTQKVTVIYIKTV